jgi:hypothetical protein
MIEWSSQYYLKELPRAILYMLAHLGARPEDMTTVASGTEDALQRERELGDG